MSNPAAHVGRVDPFAPSPKQTRIADNAAQQAAAKAATREPVTAEQAAIRLGFDSRDALANLLPEHLRPHLDRILERPGLLHEASRWRTGLMGEQPATLDMVLGRITEKVHTAYDSAQARPAIDAQHRAAHTCAVLGNVDPTTRPGRESPLLPGVPIRASLRGVTAITAALVNTLTLEEIADATAWLVEHGHLDGEQAPEQAQAKRGRRAS